MLDAWTNPVYTFARATGMMGRRVKGKAWLHLNNLLLVRRLSSGPFRLIGIASANSHGCGVDYPEEKFYSCRTVRLLMLAGVDHFKDGLKSCNTVPLSTLPVVEYHT